MFSSNFIISPFQGQDENIHLEKWNKIKGQSQQLSKRLLCFPPESPIWAVGERMSMCASVLFLVMLKMESGAFAIPLIVGRAFVLSVSGGAL